MGIKKTAYKKKCVFYLQWILPLLLFLLYAPFSAKADLDISSYFYKNRYPDCQSFSQHPFPCFFYRYGTMPAYIFGTVSFALSAASYRIKAYKKYRQLFLVLFLTTFISTVLLPSTFKTLWCRPRPFQIQQFGGSAPFRPFYIPLLENKPDDCKSLPSGHVAAGCTFVALCFAAKRIRRPSMFYIGFIVTAFLAPVMMLTRIALGAHYLSDTLISLLLVWYAALICDHFVWEKV